MYICLYNDCPHDTSIPQHLSPPKGPRCRGVSCGAIKPLGGVRPAAEGGPRRGMGLEIAGDPRKLGDFGWGFYGDLIGVNKMLMGFNDDSMGFS